MHNDGNFQFFITTTLSPLKWTIPGGPASDRFNVSKTIKKTNNFNKDEVSGVFRIWQWGAMGSARSASL